MANTSYDYGYGDDIAIVKANDGNEGTEVETSTTSESKSIAFMLFGLVPLTDLFVYYKI